MSDDGAIAIVVIAMLGNPFSPSYARARSRGSARALDHSALNVALYGRSGSSWALDERRVADSDGTARDVAIGTSTMRWIGDALVVDIDERTTPFARNIRGRVVVRPEVLTGVDLAIDSAGEHRWWPIAPLARIEVDLPEPGVRFVGHGYHDANAGSGPLESAFDRWSWSRARAPEGALLTYDVRERDGAERALALRVGASGAVEPIEGSSAVALPRTLWRIARQARADRDHGARVTRSLEDGPFYARSLVTSRLAGRDVVAMHETLAADRLRSGWVRFLTGFRMRSAA